jgi:hypothetical protein
MFDIMDFFIRGGSLFLCGIIILITALLLIITTKKAAIKLFGQLWIIGAALLFIGWVLIYFFNIPHYFSFVFLLLFQAVNVPTIIYVNKKYKGVSKE